MCCFTNVKLSNVYKLNQGITKDQAKAAVLAGLENG